LYPHQAQSSGSCVCHLDGLTRDTKAPQASEPENQWIDQERSKVTSVERGKEGCRDYQQQRTHGHGSIRQQQARWANFTIRLNYKEPSYSPQPIAPCKATLTGLRAENVFTSTTGTKWQNISHFAAIAVFAPGTVDDEAYEIVQIT
jgi:hypothetical protein